MNFISLSLLKREKRSNFQTHVMDTIVSIKLHIKNNCTEILVAHFEVQLIFLSAEYSRSFSLDFPGADWL